ncbi:hypothetical protein ACT6QG_11445 [Xanthobacter sp. TB0136]|uniref:hypothetical protein n=1 Tax=Xanthobacter sp. TB0136 TaxID=3459177 RepID=UPI004039AA42
MNLYAFTFAIWALLLTPGPTNTLLALSGAGVGLKRSLRLIPAEVAAYLLVTIPLAVVGAELLGQWPEVARLVKFAAAAWVAFLAVKLWRVETSGSLAGAVTARRVFITTLLNPKALIIGLTLLPQEAPGHLALNVGVFAVSIIAVATIWAAGGAMLRRGRDAALPPVLRRAAACWLGILAAALVSSGISA